MTEAELSQIAKFELTESNLETEPMLVELWCGKVFGMKSIQYG
jgi:hypothetical protein